MSTFTNLKKCDRNQLTSHNAGLKPAPVLDSVHPLNLNLPCIVYFQVHPEIVVLTLLVLGLGPVLQVHGGLAGDPLEVSQLPTHHFPKNSFYEELPRGWTKRLLWLANLRMNAPEDRGDAPSCSPLDDGDSGVQGVADPVPRR